MDSKIVLLARMLEAALKDQNREATVRYLNAIGTELNRIHQEVFK